MADNQRGGGPLSRREFIARSLAVGTMAVLAGPEVLAQVIKGGSSSNVDLRMVARPMTFPLLDGQLTQTWGYEATSRSVPPPRAGFLGPILRVNQGDYLNINFKNELPEGTTVHWHGLDVPAIMDGHPTRIVPPEGHYNYAFRVLNRAGTYWFHPHPHMRTGFQVCQGLAGILIVSDAEERALNLPSGDRDLLVVLLDRNIDTNNQFVYSFGGVNGYLGTRMLVNGVAEPLEKVGTAVYRVRILNASNARIHKLSWSNGMPMTVIASEQGLLRAPEQKPYVMLPPGERVELWVDFRNVALDSVITLRNTISSPGVDLLPFSVTQEIKDSRVLPTTLSQIPTYRLEDAANLTNPRVIPVSKSGTEWRLNNAAYDPTGVLANEVTRRGVLEVWEFTNDTGSGLIPHPIHLHSSPFQIVSRTISSTYQSSYNAIREGLVDSGWKDTFLLWPGERVKILTKPSQFAGRFLYHCHNLEHEDMGMMRNYDVLP